MCKDTKCNEKYLLYSTVDDLAEKLKAYTDLGVTPKQIRQIDRLYAEKCKEVAKLERIINAYKTIFAFTFGKLEE